MRAFSQAFVDHVLDAGSALRGDDRTHLNAILQPVADYPLLCGFHQGGGEVFTSLLAYRDDQGGCQAALPGVAEDAVGDDLGSHLQVGVRQDDQGILRPALCLDALAGGRAAGIDVPRHLGRADEAHCRDAGMVQNGVDRFRGAVDQVDHPRREGKLLEQAEHLVHGDGCALGGLDKHGIAARQGIRQEPERDHPREIERGDDGTYPHRLAQDVLVDTGGDILQDAALHHQRDAASHLHVLNRPAHLALGFFEGLAVLLDDRSRQVIELEFEQVFQLEQVLDALRGGVSRQSGKAREAARTAISTSDGEVRGTWASTCPVAGLWISSHCWLVEACQSPPMKLNSCWKFAIIKPI